MKHHFFCALEFLLKTASLHSVKHRSIILHSYFRCKSSHWSLQSHKYLLKFQLSQHYQYSFVASTLVVAFLFLDTSFYIDSFILKRKTLIHPKKKSSEVQFMYFVYQATRCCQCFTYLAIIFFSLTTYSKFSSFK